MPKKAETLFKEKVLDDLKALGARCFAEKIQQKATCGTPDIFACVGGTFVAIELKTDVGRLEKLQEYVLRKVVAAGGVAFRSSPETWARDLELISTLARPVSHVCP